MPVLGLGEGSVGAHGPVAIVAKFGLALSIDIFSALCAYPLDTVRRNMMMQARPATSSPTSPAEC